MIHDRRDSMRKGLIFVAILITSIFILAGCKESPDLQPELTGVWTRIIGNGPDAIEGRLRFNPDATFDFTIQGDPHGHMASKGRYSQTGHEITFLGGSCVDPGTYRFRVNNNVLSFLPMEDDCLPRKNDLTGDWNKVEE